MADIKVNYPATTEDSVALTFGVQGLASDANLLAGRESSAVDNTSNLDLDHLVSGVIRLGTTPTVDKVVALYAYSAVKIVSGTPTYPDVLDGTDSDETITSEYVKQAMLKLLWVGNSDATTGLDLFFSGLSIAQAFGGSVPPYWGLFLVHDTVAALDATAGDHYFHYHRVQAQSV